VCLIIISVDQHPDYSLVVAGNRDEFHARRTATAQFWEEAPDVLGGRDLEAGGTWLGITRSGRISVVTNYRDLRGLKSVAPSRGHLVSDFLTGNSAAQDYLAQVKAKGAEYNGFNLLTGSSNELWYYSNYADDIRKVSPGVHGLSNHLLDTPWPKVVRGEELIGPLLRQPVLDPKQILDALYDERRGPDAQLPDTGVGLERERMLSSIFIKSPDYGSRCSTAILVHRNGHVHFSERVYDLKRFTHETHTFEFEIQFSG
jgi:uncharacterized protein with NRDE domain